MRLKAKKSYGQHFLNNEFIAEKIAQSLPCKDTDSNILEVGPGKGILTKYLIQRTKHLIAVDADPDMIFFLKKNFSEFRDKVIQADFLKIELDKIFNGEPFHLIGNYPYNISSQILFKMLKYKELIPSMAGMFQKEVAERITAQPNTKAYGVLSVLSQAFYEGEYLFNVENTSFSPPPKVRSGVIRLIRKRTHLEECSESHLRTVVKTSFGQRRKMLRNSLKSLIKDPDRLKDSFFKQRPENLSVQDFVELTAEIYKSQ